MMALKVLLFIIVFSAFAIPMLWDTFLVRSRHASKVMVRTDTPWKK
jgi:hypothetical protein